MLLDFWLKAILAFSSVVTSRNSDEGAIVKGGFGLYSPPKTVEKISEIKFVSTEDVIEIQAVGADVNQDGVRVIPMKPIPK